MASLGHMSLPLDNFNHLPPKLTNKRSTNDIVNHMKDINEVKDTQPLSFNLVRCSGVAARAGSVHFNGQQHHQDPVPQGSPFSKKF